MPKISVIIPSYNHASYISEAIQSVLNQTERDLELIIVDDGSTDGTYFILAEINDPRCRVILQDHQGAHAALNRGLVEAQGSYLAILNSDDVYYPQRIKHLVNFLESNKNVGLVGSYIEVIDARNRTLGIKHGYWDLEPWPLSHHERSFRSTDDWRGVLLTENFFATTSNFVFRRSLYEQIGGFRPLRYTHDWDFLLRASAVSDVAIVPEVLLRYRVHNKNTIRQDKIGMIFEICWCLAVHLPNHINDADWFGKEHLARRIEQLLYSIYTFGCEQVLIVMLLQRLYENQLHALEMLQLDNPIREKYLRFIQEHLATCENRGGSSIERTIRNIIKNWGKHA